MKIVVFGASSCAMPESVYECAHELGQLIALDRDELVFGAGDTGVMGACARGAHAAQGRVTGVIPEALNLPGVAYPACDELIVTHDLRDRMEVVERLGDAFIAMPGGFGTLYELFEVITLNQLHYIRKPVVLLNAGGYYNPLTQMFERTYAEHAAREGCRALYEIVDSAEEALRWIRSWRPARLERWLTDLPELNKETEA